MVQNALSMAYAELLHLQKDKLTGNETQRELNDILKQMIVQIHEAEKIQPLTPTHGIFWGIWACIMLIIIIIILYFIWKKYKNKKVTNSLGNHRVKYIKELGGRLDEIEGRCNNLGEDIEEILKKRITSTSKTQKAMHTLTFNAVPPPSPAHST